MDAVTLLGSALALSMDNFAVAAVVIASLPRPTAWHTFRLTFNFGVFQSIMTALGCLGGTGLSSFVGGIGYWISFGLLTLLGINMLRDSPEDDHSGSHDPTKGWRIIGLSLACAIDALTAGVALSLTGRDTWMLAPVFGLSAGVMAFLGTRVGRRAGLHLGAWPQRIGGFVLIAIGIRGEVQHFVWQ
ncbi:MAG TPA: manganese efflux pump MntP family protein [Desulfomonilaceae bacterium]|nr:manganese efflux pump MntP family protein [Desulfomonilaceae bacterium]